MKVFSKKAIEARRVRVKEELDAFLKKDDLVLLFSGEPIQKPGGLDRCYPFLSHPDYFWLKGIRRPWGALAYSKEEGWKDFVAPISEDEKLWEGNYDSVEGDDIQGLSSYVSGAKFQRVFVMGQPSSQDKKYEKSVTQDQIEKLQGCIDKQRRIKDEEEVQLIDRVFQTAEKGYLRLEEFLREGLTERDIQVEYEYTVLKAGAHKLPYETIVGSGINSATLHAIPTNRVLKKDELVLIDAGSDIDDYCVDITRMFSTSGRFTSKQKIIYDLVLKAQEECSNMCKPGVEWFDIHKQGARIIATGLKELGILNCSVDSALESEAISVFFPHGIGHMVGLGVRDVGGRRNPPRKTCGVYVRVDLPLEANMLMTVEPGIYFVPAIINNEDYRRRFKSDVNWSEVEKWKDFGGIRIEDNILVGETPRNLTKAIKK